jgi:hypothetical protein
MSKGNVLAAALARLETALRQLPATAMHLIPDLVLRSYLHDAVENGTVVQLLISTKLRHRAFPNARACFEAAQQALLLASDPNYDLAGAKAWVYGHRKDLYQGGEAERAGLLRDLPEHLPAAEFFAKQFKEMQETWNSFAQGKGALLQEARVALERQPRRPDNWAGLNIAETLERRLDAMLKPKAFKAPPVKPSDLLRAAYALLNRETHPHSLRLEPSRVRGSANGAVSFVYDPDNPAEQADLAEKLTLSSLNLAMAAASLRFQMPDSA